MAVLNCVKICEIFVKRGWRSWNSRRMKFWLPIISKWAIFSVKWLKLSAAGVVVDKTSSCCFVVRGCRPAYPTGVHRMTHSVVNRVRCPSPILGSSVVRHGGCVGVEVGKCVICSGGCVVLRV